MVVEAAAAAAESAAPKCLSPGSNILCEDGASERRTACTLADAVNLPPVDGKGEMTADVKEEGLNSPESRELNAHKRMLERTMSHACG